MPPCDEKARWGEILLDSMYQFVGLLDPEGRLLDANKASLAAAGAERSAVIGRPFWETPWWRDLPEAQARLRAAVAEACGGQFVRYEVEHRGHGGTGLLTADFSLTPVRDRAGQVVYLVAEGRDITDRKQVEAEVLRKGEELAALNARLEHLDAAKTHFFANVSHELRTPLTLILGPVERLLATNALTPPQRDALDLVRRNARLLLKHVNDLLEVSRLDAGKAEVRRSPVDLARLVRLTASHFGALAEERGIRYAVETPDALVAQVDADKIQHVLLNLLSNAFKFTPAGGRIRCALCTAGESMILTVEDSGPGVAPSQRAAIFERFAQGEGGPTRHAGTGLGLAIARDFVVLHGGCIAVADAPGGGALFTVDLPLGTSAGASPSPASGEEPDGDLPRLFVDALASAAKASDTCSAEGQALVLVVEDNPEMRRFLAEVLGTRYRVATADDGEAGLARTLELRPDLVLSDVMMPRMSGDQLVSRIREHPELDGIPIVLLTALADEELRVRMLRGGALDYLTKPFGHEELLARVANLVALKRTRKVLEEELQSRGRDIEALATEVVLRKRQLEAALESARLERDRAEGASRAKSDLLSLVSHELMTPVTALQLGCRRLERDRTTPLATTHVAVVRRMGISCERLAEAIQSLLEHARIESGRLTIRCELVDLAALAVRVLDEIRPLAEQKGLELRLFVDQDLPPLVGDERLVRVVLGNLVSNAVKFTDAGWVVVLLAYRDGVHRIAVKDSGPGIPAEDRAHIFEPFTQLLPLKHKHLPGIGLGLALAREMASALGGQIELESGEGPGSTFTVLLPGEPARPVTELH